MTESHGFRPRCVCVFLQVCVSVSLHLWLCMSQSRFSCLQRVVYLSGQEIKFFSRCDYPVHVGLWVIENPDGYVWASRKKPLLQEWKCKYMFWNDHGAHFCLGSTLVLFLVLRGTSERTIESMYSLQFLLSDLAEMRQADSRSFVNSFPVCWLQIEPAVLLENITCQRQMQNRCLDVFFFLRFTSIDSYNGIFLFRAIATLLKVAPSPPLCLCTLCLQGSLKATKPLMFNNQLSVTDLYRIQASHRWSHNLAATVSN